jgi:hypothetical protein
MVHDALPKSPVRKVVVSQRHRITMLRTRKLPLKDRQTTPIVAARKENPFWGPKGEMQ